ncbi:MAG: hypothetical protein ACR5K9_06570 [Wolbachia sp.]
MSKSIWKWGNTAHIAKTGIEGTVALASLAAAITSVLIATKVIAVPESLALISTIVNPVGIAVLLLVATYFAALAYCSYKQMHKNEEINGTETSGNVEKTEVTVETIKKEIEAKTKDLATKADLDKKADKTGVNAELAKKASKADTDAKLAKKADASALEAKADKAEIISTVLDRLSEDSVQQQFKQSLGLQEQVT